MRIYPNVLPITLFGSRTRDRPLPRVTMPERFRSGGGRGNFRFSRAPAGDPYANGIRNHAASLLFGFIQHCIN